MEPISRWSLSPWVNLDGSLILHQAGFSREGVGLEPVQEGQLHPDPGVRELWGMCVGVYQTWNVNKLINFKAPWAEPKNVLNKSFLTDLSKSNNDFN